MRSIRRKARRGADGAVDDFYTEESVPFEEAVAKLRAHPGLTVDKRSSTSDSSGLFAVLPAELKGVF